jgi:GntR family transcriptional regulator
MIRFTLDPKSGVPIYRQIQDQIRYGIASGKLRPTEQLPTVRALAVDLAVNPNTIIKAYTELERLGILTTEQGSGTFVAPQPAVTLSPRERHDKLAALCNEFLAQVAQYGFGPADVLQAVRTLAMEVHTREPMGRTRTGDRGRQAH